jgi:hypothetical protein
VRVIVKIRNYSVIPLANILFSPQNSIKYYLTVLKIKLMSTIQKADTRKSTNLLKKYLRERFNIEVSVKSEYYSMGSSLNISYNLGIDEKEVKSIVKNLQYSRFDGMTDCSYNVDNAGIIIDGYQLAEFKHVFVKQDWSEDFSYKLAKFLSDNIKFQDVTELESKEQIHSRFSELYGGAWTWSQLLWQLFKTSNFATQDESKINLLEVHHSDKNSWQIYFIYEIDGIKYNTEEIPTITKRNKTSPY